MRQQRTSARRRVRPVITGVPPGQMDWQIVSFTPQSIMLEIYASVTTVLTSLAGYSLSGIPPIFNATTSEMPAAAFVTNGKLEIVYPSVFPNEFTLILQENTPQFRGPRGEYLTSKAMSQFAPPPQPVDSEINAAVVNSAVIDLQVLTGPSQLYISGTPVVENVTQATFSLSVVSSPGVLSATFFNNQMIGDQYRGAGGIANYINDTSGTLLPFDVIGT